MSLTMRSFPSGGAGLGLLLLRLAAGAALAALAMPEANGSTRGSWVLALLSLASGVALVLGIATRWAGVLGAVAAAALVLPALEQTATLGGRMAALLLAAAATALALVGPGAFSLDARLFGRREIIIPQSSRNQR